MELGVLLKSIKYMAQKFAQNRKKAIFLKTTTTNGIVEQRSMCIMVSMERHVELLKAVPKF